MGFTTNEVHLRGRAGKDAEAKFTSTGKQVVKISLATGGGKKKGSDETWPTDWHSLELWDVEGSEDVSKGDDIEVWGRIKYDTYDDKRTGQKKYYTNIVCNKLVWGGAEDESTKELPANHKSPKARPVGDEITDADIPF